MFSIFSKIARVTQRRGLFEKKVKTQVKFILNFTRGNTVRQNNSMRQQSIEVPGSCVGQLDYLKLQYNHLITYA